MTSKEDTQGCVFDQVVAHSGLDKDTIIKELGDDLLFAGKDINELTIEDVRSIVAQYMRKVFLEQVKGSST